jgi:hypothetical protein
MAKPDKNSKPAGVTVSTRAPKAKTIFVAGTFNDWNPFSHPLTLMGDGQWSLSLDLPAGLYEYKFIIDGEWCCEPGCDRPYDGCSGCVANEFGTMNRVLVVEGVAEQASRQRQLA